MIDLVMIWFEQVPPTSNIATVHDITIADNILKGTPGCPIAFPGKQRGILCYADVDAPGFNLQIHNNQISTVFLALDLNYFRDSLISNTTVTAPTGAGNFLAALTWMTNSSLRGLSCGQRTDEHAIQCLSISPGAGASTMPRPSDNLSLSGIDVVTAPTKSCVLLNCGNSFTISDVRSASSKHFVQCGGAKASSIRCMVGGLTGAVTGPACAGGIAVPWTAVPLDAAECGVH